MSPTRQLPIISLSFPFHYNLLPKSNLILISQSIMEWNNLLLLLLLLFFFFFSAATSEFQTLTLRPLPNPSPLPLFSHSESLESTAGLTLELHHLDSLSPNKTPTHLFTLRLHRDALRVHALTSRCTRRLQQLRHLRSRPRQRRVLHLPRRRNPS